MRESTTVYYPRQFENPFSGDPMTTIRRFLALTPGNPMNPVTLIVLGFFAIVFVGFPPLMIAAGLGTGGVVLVMMVVLITAVFCIGLVVWLGRRYSGDMDRLLAGEHWAHWQLTPAERERFVTGERTRSHGEARRYLLYSLGLAIFGALLMWAYTETATGAAIGFGVLGAAGLLVVLTTWLWGGARPRREATNLDDIYLGDLGIYHLGRYMPVRGFNLFLTRTDYQPGDPPVLHFEVGSRTQHGSVRTNEVRVLVPAGREAEAEALAERFQRELVG
jgi:hypothetical protein